MDNKPNEGGGQQSRQTTPDPVVPPTPPFNNPSSNQAVPSPPPSEPEPRPIKKSRLQLLVKVTSFVFWIPFGLLALVYAYLAYQVSHGASGTEFAGIILTPIELGIAVVGLFYLALLIVYVFSKSPSRPKKILSLLIILFLLGVYGWQIAEYVSGNKKINQSNKILTDAEVISLIDSCTAQAIQKEGDKVNLLLKDDAYYDAKGNYLWRSTTASAAHWDSFVAEVQKVKTKCGNITALDAQSGP